MNKFRKHSKRWLREAIIGYLFGAISIVGLLWFYIVPFLVSFFQTIIKIDDGISWKGIKLYKDLLIHSTFKQTLINTFYMTLVGLPLILVFTVILTYYFNKLIETKSKGVDFWMAVHLIPMILPSVVIATIIKIIFEKYGLLNSLFIQFNITPVQWLNSHWAFWILCIILCWKNIGYSMVVLLSGMRSIEKEQSEAAALEGASNIVVFLKIKLPQLAVFIRFIMVMGIMGIFKLYRESFLILGDSPPDEAYMIQNFLNNNFASLNYDRTIAASVLLFLLMGIVLFLLFNFTGDQYEK